MVSTRLSAVDDRLARAEEHLESVKTMLRDYFASDRYSLRGKFDPQFSETPFSGQAETLPPRLHTLVGELLHDLRSSLDHLAWQLVLINDGVPGDNTAFPVLNVRPSRDKYGVPTRPNAQGGVSERTRRLFDEAQPYTWNHLWQHHPLWFLHCLYNIDKHRHFITTGGAFAQTYFAGDRPVTFTWTAKPVNSDEHGAHLALTADDPSVQMEGRTTFQVVTRQTQNIASRPLFEVLEQCRDIAVSIVRDAKATCL